MKSSILALGEKMAVVLAVTAAWLHGVPCAAAAATEAPRPNLRCQVAPTQGEAPKSDFLELFDAVDRLGRAALSSNSPKLQETLADLTARLSLESIREEFRRSAATQALRACYSHGQRAVLEQARRNFATALPGWEHSTEVREILFCVALFTEGNRQRARQFLASSSTVHSAPVCSAAPPPSEAMQSCWIYALGSAGHDLGRIGNLDIKGHAPLSLFTLTR
jgi:hypothetical protein